MFSQLDSTTTTKKKQHYKTEIMKTENMFKNCWMNMLRKMLQKKIKFQNPKKRQKKTLENGTQRFDYKR